MCDAHKVGEADGRSERSAGCFAADVVRAGLDPLTGRTLSFNHVPMAAWAGHLCDLLIAGLLVDDGGAATQVSTTVDVELHPLVGEAWHHVQPRLPRPWRLMFGPQVIDTNTSAERARRWLVDTGVWQRRRTVFGWRYTATGATPRPAPPNRPGDPAFTHAVLRTLLAIAQVGDHLERTDLDSTVNGTPRLTASVSAVVTATSDLIEWKRGRPPLPAVGGQL